MDQKLPPPASRIRLSRSWRFQCPVALRYAIAVLLVCLAWMTTVALRSSIDVPSFQTPFFICAIVLSSWAGGMGPGLVATLLSIFMVEFMFTEPRYTLGFTMSEVPKFAVFFLTGGFISWLAQRQRGDEEALLVARESLEDKVRERTLDLEHTNQRLTLEIEERVRAQDALHRLNRAWRVRSLFNRAVARSTSEHELLRRVCQSLVKAGHYPLAWIAFAKGSSVHLEAYAGGTSFRSLEKAWAEGGYGHDLATKAIRSGQSHACLARERAAHLAPDQWALGNSVKAVVALPLSPDGQVIGSLMVYSDEVEAFDEKETDLLQQAADDVAQGIMLYRTRAAQVAAESALETTQAELARVARVTTMGELTASIAHEVNQPLAAVITNANACLRWLARDPANLDEAQEAVRRIIRDGKRGSEVIARIRTLLKKEEVVRSPVDLNEVILEMLALTKGELDGIAVETALTHHLPSVHADRVQIQQVLLNLLLNARDAMHSVTDRPKSLCVSSHLRDGGHVEIGVRDAGIGLAPEKRERVFETFFSTKPDGLGMGLSICRSIVEQHGGRLWADANEVHGATFWFKMPLEQQS